EDPTGGCPVQGRGVLDDLGLAAEAREHRHLARERGAQRVDGLDAQAVGDLGSVGNAFSTRLRISAAAFLVKVIARISSGFWTMESSLMNRLTSRSVLPE